MSDLPTPPVPLHLPPMTMEERELWMNSHNAPPKMLHARVARPLVRLRSPAAARGEEVPEPAHTSRNIVSTYISEIRLKYGEGFKAKDWQKVAIEACNEVDNLRSKLKDYQDAFEELKRRGIRP
jgi:hypothetical protein